MIFCLALTLTFLPEFLKKRKFSMQILTEILEAATSSYSVIGDFLQYIYPVLVTKNHHNIRSRCLVYEFSLPNIFEQY